MLLRFSGVIDFNRIILIRNIIIIITFFEYNELLIKSIALMIKFPFYV